MSLTTLIKKCLANIEQESKEINDGVVSYPYCYGATRALLKAALVEIEMLKKQLEKEATNETSSIP